MLHLSKDGAVLARGIENDTYPIPRTSGEQAEYDKERLERARACEANQANECCDDECPSP